MTTNQTNEKLMRRIQKLLNMANDNANENESHSAMLKAQMLMAEHSISVSDLNVATKKEETKKVINETGGTDWIKIQWYHRAVADVIADNFRCYYFWRNSNGMSKLYFMGVQEDAEIAKMVYQFALIALDYNADQYIKEQREVRYIRDSKGVKTDYMRGFVRGLKEKFDTQVKEETVQVDNPEQLKMPSLALVLVKDDALVEAHKSMKFKTAKASKGGKKSAGDAEAYHAGKEKGKNFESATGFLS